MTLYRIEQIPPLPADTGEMLHPGGLTIVRV
jgi:hypothetical protein